MHQQRLAHHQQREKHMNIYSQRLLLPSLQKWQRWNAFFNLYNPQYQPYLHQWIRVAFNFCVLWNWMSFLWVHPICISIVKNWWNLPSSCVNFMSEFSSALAGSNVPRRRSKTACTLVSMAEADSIMGIGHPRSNSQWQHWWYCMMKQ